MRSPRCTPDTRHHLDRGRCRLGWRNGGIGIRLALVIHGAEVEVTPARDSGSSPRRSVNRQETMSNARGAERRSLCRRGSFGRGGCPATRDSCGAVLRVCGALRPFGCTTERGAATRTRTGLAGSRTHADDTYRRGCLRDRWLLAQPHVEDGGIVCSRLINDSWSVRASGAYAPILSRAADSPSFFPCASTTNSL